MFHLLHTWKRVAVAALLVGFVPPALADEPERLADRVDPARDDWAVEGFHVAAVEQLERLAAVVAAGGPAEEFAALFAAGARADLLGRTTGGETLRRADGYSIVIGAPPDDARRKVTGPEGLRRLARRFAAIRDLVVDLEMLEAQPDAAGWDTRVRVEARGTRAGRRLQRTAVWRVRWTPVAANGPRIRGIDVLAWEEAERAGAAFVDRTAAVIRAAADRRDLEHGGEYWHGRMDAIRESMLLGHHGIAVGDANGDDRDDLYVAMPTGLPNRLFLQQVDGSVRDVATAWGVDWLDDTKGVLFADTDNDGDQDLLMAIGPVILLAKNAGNESYDRFVAMRAPTAGDFYSLSVADYDLDGDLDIFGARYVERGYGISLPLPFHDANNGPPNHLMRNDGSDRFTDVTTAAGLGVNNSRFSLVGVFGDYDDDGDSDLYVTNDFGRNNLYRNDDGHFVDVAAAVGVEDQAAGMGASWADFDGDGDLDLHVTNMFSTAGLRVAGQPRFQIGMPAGERDGLQRLARGDTLFANAGDGTFDDVTAEAGIRIGRWGWGGGFFDLNADGLADLVIPNGFLTGAGEHDL